jgi:hypothetical protein
VREGIGTDEALAAIEAVIRSHPAAFRGDRPDDLLLADFAIVTVWDSGDSGGATMLWSRLVPTWLRLGVMRQLTLDIESTYVAD